MLWNECFLCFFLCLQLTESLPENVSDRYGHIDQVVQELHRNFSRFQHEMDLRLSLLMQRHNNEILVQNQTIIAQNVRIQEMEQRKIETLRNFSILQEKCESMEMEQIKTISTQRAEVKELERLQNQTLMNMSIIHQRYENLLTAQNKTIADQQQKISKLEQTLNYSMAIVLNANRQQQLKTTESKSKIRHFNTTMQNAVLHLNRM